MNCFIPSLAIASSLVMTSLVVCQSDAALRVANGAYAAASEAVTQRPPLYIVRFKQRSFDLSELRGLIRASRHKTAGPAEQAAVAVAVSALEKRARAERAGFIRFVEGEKGKVEEVFWLVNAASVRADEKARAEILRHPDVASMDRDLPRGPAFIKTSTNAKNHRADTVHRSGQTGKGVSVAIVDSGLDMQMGTAQRPHATFFVAGDPKNKTGGGIGGSRVLANYKLGVLPAEDAISHGTPVAAVAAGEKWNAGSGSDRGHAPGAKIVGYGVADLPNGYANIFTLVRAWQQVTKDAAKHNIRVANFSYFGAPDPLVIDEQAMDQAARTADLLITVSGGNSATAMTQAHGATNVISVGAVSHDAHHLASFSIRGTLQAGGKRAYPNLVANGVDMILPAIDNESLDRKQSGSSYAAPAVAGAAALYRSARPAATALETRAAIIASTEDINRQNASHHGLGYGYLRDDLLFAIANATAGGITLNGSLTTSSVSTRLSFAAQKGRFYVVSLCWNRHDTTKLSWSNLDLEVRVGKVVIARSVSAAELSEKLVFSVPATSQVEIRVLGTRLESATVPFALVVAESVAPYVFPRIDNFGKSCRISSSLDPILVGYGKPQFGGSYNLVGATLGQGQPVVLTIGFSNTKFGAFVLPLDLSKVGAPGCTLYTSIEHMIPGVSASSGLIPYTIKIPAVPGLIGAHVYHQLLIPNAASNKLGLALSSAVDVLIGG